MYRISEDAMPLCFFTELAGAAREHDARGHAVFFWVEHVAAFAAEFEGYVFFFCFGVVVGAGGGGGGGGGHGWGVMGVGYGLLRGSESRFLERVGAEGGVAVVAIFSQSWMSKFVLPGWLLM